MVNVNVKYVEICLLYVKQDKVPVTKVGEVLSLKAYGYLLNRDMRFFSARRIGTFEQPALLTGLKVYLQSCVIRHLDVKLQGRSK